MNRQFAGETWSVLLPAGWAGRHEAECATLVADRGVGALQLSASLKDSEVTDVDLRGFAAEHLDAGARPRPVQFGDFSGFGIAYTTDDLSWCHWYLRNGSQALFVTYACAPEDRGLEEGAVFLILSTLSASGGSPPKQPSIQDNRS